jgi:hypothetical protein
LTVLGLAHCSLRLPRLLLLLLQKLLLDQHLLELLLLRRALEPLVPHERPPPPPVHLHSHAAIASRAPCLRAWHEGEARRTSARTPRAARRAAPGGWGHATSFRWFCRCCGYGGGGTRPASALLARPPNSHAIGSTLLDKDKEKATLH